MTQKLGKTFTVLIICIIISKTPKPMKSQIILIEGIYKNITSN